MGRQKRLRQAAISSARTKEAHRFLENKKKFESEKDPIKKQKLLVDINKFEKRRSVRQTVGRKISGRIGFSQTKESKLLRIKNQALGQRLTNSQVELGRLQRKKNPILSKPTKRKRISTGNTPMEDLELGINKPTGGNFFNQPTVRLQKRRGKRVNPLDPFISIQNFFK